jgi:hypothetical protein
MFKNFVGIFFSYRVSSPDRRGGKLGVGYRLGILIIDVL